MVKTTQTKQTEVQNGQKPEQQSTGRKPDYKSSGIAIWINQSKEGKEYLSINLVGHNTIFASKNE